MLRRRDIEACIVRQRTRLSVNTFGGLKESEGRLGDSLIE